MLVLTRDGVGLHAAEAVVTVVLSVCDALEGCDPWLSFGDGGGGGGEAGGSGSGGGGSGRGGIGSGRIAAEGCEL